MLSAVGLGVIDPPAPERSFWPWSIFRASWNLLFKTTLWGSCLACSKEWWPCFLWLRRKNERGFQGLWHGRHNRDFNDFIPSESVLSSSGKSEQLMSRKTQSFLSLTLTNLTCGFNQDIWYALFKVPSLSHQSFSMAVLSQIKHENTGLLCSFLNRQVNCIK